MSRYDWPASRPRLRDEPGQRQAWNAERDAGTNVDAIEAAREMRRLHEAAALPGALAALAPTGPDFLWLPIGPTTTIGSPEEAEQRVAGRVRDLQVSPDGQRIYAASAIGGVWYSADAGASWEPVGPFAATVNRGDITPTSNTLTCGAIHVRFAPAGTPKPEEHDEVWVGTGEPSAFRHPSETGVLNIFGGVGVLHSVGPVGKTRGRPDLDPWTPRQAQPRTGYAGLRGAGVYSFAVDPDNARRLVAATTQGLHVHDPNAVAGTDPWSLVTDPTWDSRPKSPRSGGLTVTDVVWVRGDPTATPPAPSRLWVAIREGGTALTGLWRSDNGVAGPFTEVLLPGARDATGMAAVNRLGIAAAPNDRDVLYVLGSGPRVWRVDGAATVRRVAPGTTKLPAGLFGSPDVSNYDLAIAVDPHQSRRFLTGGAAVTSPDGNYTVAALFRLTVGAAPDAGGAWPADFAGGNERDPTFVGADLHPDVHRLRWPDVAGTGHVFAATDGGIYHSAADGDLGTFVSQATGMPVSEANYIDSHSDTDGAVLIGCQDNGAQLRLGGTWRRVLGVGDAGGVAFDPGVPGRMLAQHQQSTWAVETSTPVSPPFRTGPTPAQKDENTASRFYSNPAVRLRRTPDPTHPRGITQLAVGTDRVWYSETWGRSRKSADGSRFLRDWVTLPKNTDPLAGATVTAAQRGQNVLAAGNFPTNTTDTSRGIRAMRWGSDDRLYVLLPGAIYRLDRTKKATPPAKDEWTLTTIHTRPAMPATGSPPAPAISRLLPPNGSLNDLAVHDVTAGPHGSFYLATSHPTEPVWFFDGNSPGTWFPCGLGVLPPPSPPPPPPGSPDGVRAPAYAVVVDPAKPQNVYVGTAVGVWKGVLTPAPPGGNPKWDWSIFSNGLPEAAAQDLVIVGWPASAPTVRLMRAALQARGAWEVDLDTAAAPVTFVRVHHYDTRRIRPAPVADPLAGSATLDWTLDWAMRRDRDHRDAAGKPAPHPDGTPQSDLLWHASPDIRLRPAPGTPLPPPTTLPWTNAPADRYQLWAIQTALHALDPKVVPNGRWTPWFGRRVAKIRKTIGLSETAKVDSALWTAVQAGMWSDPWAAGGPTEADMLERIVGMATPRTGGVMARATSAASVAIPAQRALVDVCVHRRGLDKAAAGDVAVLLLRLPLPTGTPPAPGPANWAATAALAVPGLEAAMHGVPPGGGPLPGTVSVAPWAVADTVTAVRRPTKDIRTAEAVVVTFTVDFTGLAGTWLLLAVVHHGSGTPDLSGATLLAQVLGSPHLAARSIQVV